MAVVFKYKNPVSRNYAPGFVKCGLDGSVGNKGRSGNAVYFVDFDLDNSYDIEMALQKIENNYVLANDSIKQLEGREYMVNDLLLSNSGKCYRIIEASEDSVFNNFKYDIEFLGAIKNNTDNNMKHVRIYDVTGLRFYSKKTGKLIKSYEPRQLSCWVNNRTEKPYTTDFYSLMQYHNDDEDFALYGAWLKMVAVTSTDDHQKFTNKDGLTGSSYSFSILLNANKSYALEGFPCEYSSDPIVIGTEKHSEGTGVSLNFKKKLEFPNITVKTESFFLPRQDKTAQLIKEELLFNEVTKPGAKMKRPTCTTSYMSDYSMDSYHPFGNNIMCTLSTDRDMWYKSGMKARSYTTTDEEGNPKTETVNVPNSIKLSSGLYKQVYGATAVNSVLETVDKNLNKFGAGLTFTQTDVDMVPMVVDYNKNVYSEQYANTSEPLKAEWFPQYAAGQSLGGATEEETQIELDNFVSDSSTSSGLMLYPKYPTYSELNKGKLLTNYKGGNSLYFSGMNKFEVPYSIFNYVTSSLNTYQSVIKSAATKESIITEVPVLIDTYYRNKSFYVSFVGDDEDDDESFYNDPTDAEKDDPTPPSNRDDETDKEFQHFWSFKAPLHIPFVENGNTVTVYFITNKDSDVKISMNESEDIIEQVVTKQRQIFTVKPDYTPIDDLESLNIPDLNPKYLTGYWAYKVEITAKYPTDPVLTETYVGMKLRAETTALESLDYLKDVVISESIVSYSDPTLIPNVPDASIGGTEEKPDDDRNIYTLTVKHIPGSIWYGAIAGVQYENQSTEISEKYIAKTPYNITYKINNTEKYFFLEEAKPGEIGEYEIDGKMYVKKTEITFEGTLKSDLVIGEDVIIKLVTFDVTVVRGTDSFLDVREGMDPSIYFEDVPYGTIIERLTSPDGSNFYEVIDAHYVRQPDDEYADLILDKKNLDYNPDEASVLTRATTVEVKAIVLDREPIGVTITVMYPTGATSTNQDAYKEYASIYKPTYVLYPHYQILESYKYVDDSGVEQTMTPSISILGSNTSGGTQYVDPIWDVDGAYFYVKDPTQYGTLTINAYASFVSEQKTVVGATVVYHDWIENTDVEQFIIFNELGALGTVANPLNVAPGATLQIIVEYREVRFESPTHTEIYDPKTSGCPAFTYKFVDVEETDEIYSFVNSEHNYDTEFGYNTAIEVKINEDAPKTGVIKINNKSTAGDEDLWCTLNIQTAR